MSGALVIQKKVLKPLELELWTPVSAMWLLGTEPCSSAKANVLN